jgi:hypothetical protein
MGAKQGAKVPVVVWVVSGLRPHSEGAAVRLPPLEQTRPPVAWRGRSDQETPRSSGKGSRAARGTDCVVPSARRAQCHLITPCRPSNQSSRWHWVIALGGDSEVGLLPGCSGSQVDVAPVLMAGPRLAVPAPRATGWSGGGGRGRCGGGRYLRCGRRRRGRGGSRSFGAEPPVLDVGQSGSGSVVSCSSFAPMSARSVTLETFPTWVRGSASMISRRSGHLYLAKPAASR